MLDKIRNIAAWALQLIIAPLFILDGFSKLDKSLEALAIMPTATWDVPVFILTLLGYVEFAFAILVLFNVGTFFFALGLLIVPFSTFGILHFRDIAPMSGLGNISFGDLGNSIATLSVPNNQLIAPAILTILLIILAILRKKDAKEKRNKRKERSAAKSA